MIKYLKPLKLFQESLKRSSVLIGLNVSDEYVSLAISVDIKCLAEEYDCFERDGRILDNLVDRVQECMSTEDLEGMIIASKYPVGPPMNHLHTLVDDLCKKGKFEGLKYTCWKDDTRSSLADFQLNQFIDLHNVYEREYGVGVEVNRIIDSFSAYHMLQANLDVFNSLVQR